MTSKKLLLLSAIAIPALGLLTSSTLDSNGKFANTGSPGEQTCSQATCHGAGNGNGSTGGLPDNGGPGSIAISANPAFSGGQYVPNTTYHMTITVSETGKSLFGFDFEALDNSGATTFTNNAVGTITITDATHTRKGQPVQVINGSPVFGRMNVTHQTGGGATANLATFNFDWKAPASGIVNMYVAGNAANGDALENAQDNVYTTTMQLSPQGSTGIVSHSADLFLEAYPNPASDVLMVRVQMPHEGFINLDLYSLDGKLVRSLADKKAVPGTFVQPFSTEGLAKGVYVLRASADTFSKTQRIVIN